jgi:glyoxylase-like metal-dependent hydrolase (beta-lactamase superfamily II)
VSTQHHRIATFAFGAVIGASLANAPAASAAEDPVELASGIFQFATPDIAGNVVGNSIAVVMDKDVLVFDATLLPETATVEIQALSRLTPKPVHYLVNSHWHPDHSGGNAGFVAVYPEVEIIASRKTRRLMQNTANVYIKTLEFETAQANLDTNKALKSGLGADGKRLNAKDRENLRAQLAEENRFLAQFRAVQTKLPTLVFDKALTLYHGGREFRFLALPGHTAGDVALYLPAEKILFSGDLLAYPVPFCADSRPTDWIASLETLARLDATTIVPGHGPAQHDQTYLKLVLDSLRGVQQQVEDALHHGLSFQETQKAVKLDAVRSGFTHGDPELVASFDGNFTPIIRQMYDEATEGLEQYQ